MTEARIDLTGGVRAEDVTDDQPDPEDLAPERFVALPSRFDIHEWAILSRGLGSDRDETTER